MRFAQFPRRAPRSAWRGSRAKAACRARPSEAFRHVLEGIVDSGVTADLSLRKLHLLARDLLVGDVREQMTDHVEPHALLVFRARDEPWRPRRVGGGEHLV